MPCFSPAVGELFERWDELKVLDSLEISHQKLLDRRKEVVEYGDPEAIEPRRRAALNCDLLQQTLLHRAERLLVSSGTMLLENNVVGAPLLFAGTTKQQPCLVIFVTSWSHWPPEILTSRISNGMSRMR